MRDIATYEPNRIFRIGIINIFVIIGLLRLTNLNYYLTQAIGVDVAVDNLGGGALNFNNYLGVAFLSLIILTKIFKVEARWKSGWPIYSLMLIYMANGLASPYANAFWLVYQELFLFIAVVMHLFIQKVPDDFVNRFKRAMSLLFWPLIGLMTFSAIMILGYNSWSYYLDEYNEVFVQSLDDFGIVKQRYGYLLGFMISYCLFVLKSRPKQLLVLFLAIITGFGIRSMIIGIIGATLIFKVRKPKQFLMILLIGAIGFFVWLLPNLNELIYDTRFYSFLNAYNIILEFPFGVGLGGYPVYTELFHRQLYASFFDISAVLDYIPLAPESDLVHLFGSLGLILGGLHILIQLRLVWYTYKLQPLMSSFQKCILFYFCFMTFFGISEDSIFSINYWIFFGLSSGIIASLIYKRKYQLND